MPGNFQKTQTVVDDQDITADLWNGEFDNVISNMTPEGIDDSSSSASNMQAVTDPYPAAAESLPTDLKGELLRIRYQLREMIRRFGGMSAETKWYTDVPYLFGIRGTDIASAATLTIPSDGNYFHVTGTTGITAIATKGVGGRVTLVFDGTLVITHHATTLILPGGTDITTAAGDVLEFVEDSAGNWRCVHLYEQANFSQVGDIKMSGRSSAPTGWLSCDGTAVSRTTYSSLFSAIGTTFGTGDGSTTFNLPDLRGRVPIGSGTGTGLTARTLGGKVGTETHSHQQNIIENGSGSLAVVGSSVVNGKSGTSSDGGSHTFGGTGSITGSEWQHLLTSSSSSIQPSLGVLFVIKF